MDFCNSMEEATKRLARTVGTPSVPRSMKRTLPGACVSGHGGPHFTVKCNLTGLQELYVDFDRWIIQLQTEQSRRTRKSGESSPIRATKTKYISCECTNICDEDILQEKTKSIEDLFKIIIANEYVNNSVLFDYVLYKLIDQNGRKRLILKYKKSKL